MVGLVYVGGLPLGFLFVLMGLLVLFGVIVLGTTFLELDLGLRLAVSRGLVRHGILGFRIIWIFVT